MTISVDPSERAASLMRRFAASHRELLERYDPDSIIALLDRDADAHRYHDVPEAVREMWSAAARDLGEGGLHALLNLLLLRLIERFDARSVGKRYTPAIRAKFTASFARILDAAESPQAGAYRSIDDRYLKDLGICRQRLFPAGAQLVDPYSGFHRALLFRDGLMQGLRFVQLLLKCGGNRPFYQIHTHLSELEDFNPDGWDQCYLRIAAMLELNPEIRGMWGGSWFYDPALTQVSPNLCYLRERPERNGAQVFFSDVSPDSGALETSKTRQELYRQGKYIPKSYALIWPRAPMIAWARTYSRDHAPVDA